MARRSPGAPSMTNSSVRSVGNPRVTRSLSRPLVTAAVSVAPSRRPSTCFRPAVSIPNAITMQWSRKTLPSMQTTRRSSSPSGRPRNASRRFVDSATNRRETALLDVARSVTSTGTGSNVPAYRRVDTPAATAASVCSSSGSVTAAHWKLTSGTSPSALRTRSRGTSTCRPPSVTGLSTLPPRHAGRSTWWRPFGPHSTARSASIIASRTCSPVAMHKPWNASRTPCTTPSTGNGT